MKANLLVVARGGGHGRLRPLSPGHPLSIIGTDTDCSRRVAPGDQIGVSGDQGQECGFLKQ